MRAMRNPENYDFPGLSLNQNTVILNMIYKSYNSRGVLTSTEQDRSRIKRIYMYP